MFALYDYDPVKSSPNPNPDAELAFKAGDIITVYGNMVGLLFDKYLYVMISFPSLLYMYMYPSKAW